MKNKTTLLISGLVLILTFSLGAVAQTTVFTYHGRLSDTGTPPTGTYQMEFRMFEAPAGGQQIGPVNTNNAVSVTGGVFTVNLNFGDNNAFPGPDRFLQISVRRNAGEGFVTLNPRQMITASPYSIRTLSALQADDSNQLGGATASQYLRTIGNGSGLTNLNAGSITTGTLSNARLGQIPTANIADSAVTSAKIAPGQVVKTLNSLIDNVTIAAGANISISTVGSTLTIASTGASNPILNQTTAQAGANFNIGGTGTANVFNAVSQYNINGAGRILSSPGSNNLFAGIGAGNANSSGGANTFVGGGSGGSNTTGANNSFVGANAGTFNTGGSDSSFFGTAAGFFNSGSQNSFFGKSAGQSNTSGTNNAFFGWSAGLSSTASNNAFFGARSGLSNTSGSNNSFFGESSGRNNTIGGDNAFVGTSAGLSNSSGTENAFFGATSGFSNTLGQGNSFFGAKAGRLNTVGNFNSFFGLSAGQATTSDLNVFVGTATGFANTSGATNTFIGASAGVTNTVGGSNTIIGGEADVAFNNLQFATAIGAKSTVLASNTVALGRANGSDAVVIYGIAGTGSFHLCLNASNQIAGCSSSLRYKKNIGGYSPGMSFVNQLRPISYDWTDTGTKDVGFGAEDIEKIDPRFVTYNKAGQVEGVKYDRLSVAFVNALKEQESQIAALQKTNAMLLKRLLQIEKKIRGMHRGKGSVPRK